MVYGEGVYGESAYGLEETYEIGSWGVLLNGVYISGGSESSSRITALENAGCGPITQSGCLITPPDGLGLPSLRVEDVVYPQRDGSRHFNDWYSSRILTFDVIVSNDPSGPGCGVRQKVKDLVNAWSRQCNDVELVLFTDCHGQSTDRALVGPFGVVGRPRVAEVVWERSNLGAARVTLRFDSTDHKIFILDGEGCPGSGEKCTILSAQLQEDTCRGYNRCYDTSWCYDQTSTEGAEGLFCFSNDGPDNTICFDPCIGSETGVVQSTEIDVEGDVCAHPTITLNGKLIDPFVENLTTGEVITYNGTIEETDPPIIINTTDGTATQGGQSRTHLLGGTVNFKLDIGVNNVRSSSFGASDSGFAEVCFRDSVVMA